MILDGGNHNGANMAGVGGCVSSSSFSFVFMLNNAERFFGSALMILLTKLLELGAGFSPIPTAARIGLAVLLLVPLCVCMMKRLLTRRVKTRRKC